MLYLTEDLLIGRGTERLCYRHPNTPELCIKVTHNHKNDKKQNSRDYAYYNNLEKRRIEWDHLPRCHGWVETNQGDGLIFDLIQNSEGIPLQSLTQLLDQRKTTLEDLQNPLENLRKYLIKNLIFTSDLRDNNIVSNVENGKPTFLYIIDGLGHHDFIKIAAHIPPLGRVKVKRQWAKFMQRMQKWG